MKSLTVILSSNALYGIPQVLDGGQIWNITQNDPYGTNYTYLSTDDGSDYNYNTGSPTATADDTNYTPWGYLVRDFVTNISLGLLKGPYSITFDPGDLYSTDVPLLKIVYNFGDDTQDFVVGNTLNLQTTTQGQPASASTPAGTPITHNYFPSSNSTIATFNPSVTAFYSNLTRWIYNISLSSVPSSIYDFDDIHLISNTPQLSTSETQNIFELENPAYLTVARVLSTVDANYPTIYPFDPNASILAYNLITWLDASDEATISKDSFGRVFLWYDKSIYRNNYFCNANDGSQSPIFEYSANSQSKRKCVRFRAAGQGDVINNQFLYAIPVGGPNYIDSIFYNRVGGVPGFTVFAVMKINQISTHDTLFSYDLNTDEQVRNEQGDGLNYLPYVNVSLQSPSSITNNASVVVEQGDTSFYFGTSAFDENNGIYQSVTTGPISQNLATYSLFSVTVSGNQNATAYFTADTAIVKRDNITTPPVNFQNLYTSTLSSFLSGGTNPVYGQYVAPGTYDTGTIENGGTDGLVFGYLGTSDAYYNSYLTDTEISEFMVFNKPLTPDEIALVQNYLVNKWDLTLQTN